MTKIKLREARPKAWVGTALTAANLAINLGSKIFGAKAQAKAQEEAAARQAALNQYNKSLSEANNLTQVLNAERDRQLEYLDDFHVDYACGGKVRPRASFGSVLKTILPFAAVAGAGALAFKPNWEDEIGKDVIDSPEWQEKYGDDMYFFRRGGKRKLRNAAFITDGGYAQPIGNATFLLRGSSHNDVNESGNTGIGINVGGKEIEAEGGEVVRNNGDEMQIYSNRIKLPRRRYLRNGGDQKITPAQAVEEGYNKDRVFEAQEAYKRSKGIKSPKGTAAFGDWFKNPNLGASFRTTDYIGLGTNILGSVLSNAITQRSLRNLGRYAPEAPARYMASRLNTYYNIHPQLANLERNRLRTNKAIYDNTWSSVAALNRMNTNNVDTVTAQNQLWGDKFNRETELMNRSILNQQEVANRNVEAENAYRNQLAEFNRNLAGARAQSNVDMIQGIGSSIGSFLQQGTDNYQNNQSRIALFAGSEKGTLERLASLGYDIDTDTAKNAYRAALTDTRTNVNDIGARQRLDFWSDYLNLRQRPKKRNAISTIYGDIAKYRSLYKPVKSLYKQESFMPNGNFNLISSY